MVRIDPRRSPPLGYSAPASCSEALGLASAIFVLARLLESWRVTPHAASHQILIFGQRLSYPAANIDAVVIVLLAVLGSVVTARALTGALREVQASRRFSGCLPGASHGRCTARC